MAKCGNDDDFSQKDASVFEKSQNEDMALSACGRRALFNQYRPFFSRICPNQSFCAKIVTFSRSAGLENVESVQDSGSPSIRHVSLIITRDDRRTRPHGRENSTFHSTHLLLHTSIPQKRCGCSIWCSLRIDDPLCSELHVQVVSCSRQHETVHAQL